MKHKSKLFQKRKLITTIILSLIVLLAAGFSTYRNYLAKNQITPTPTATPNPFAGWLTFTSLKYNFSFKFPANLGQQGAISGPATGTSEGLRSFTDPKTVTGGTGVPFNGFSLYIVTDSKGLSFDKYIAKEIAAMNTAKYTGMKNPTQIQLTNGIALISKDGQQAYYYLPSPNKNQIVVFAYLQIDPIFKETFDQVLSTFKFAGIVNTKASDCIAKTTCGGSAPCMANPAAVFCSCMGGKEKILDDGSGQSGRCNIDGKDFDEWEYFRSFSSS
jgi:putative hemolysin